MYCSRPSPTLPARCCSSPTTATSSTAWPRASSRWKTTASTSIPGNYEDYLWRKSGGPEKVAASLADSLKPSVPEPALPEATPTPEPVKAAAHPKRLNPIKLKKLEDRVAAIEQELASIDSRIAAAEESLGHYVSAEESQRTAASLEELRTQRTALLAEWESLASTLEEQSSTTV